MSIPVEKTVALADAEKQGVEETKLAHEERISRAVLAVEQVLLAENCTLADWHEVVGMFNARNEVVIPAMTVKEMSERFNKLTEHSA